MPHPLSQHRIFLYASMFGVVLGKFLDFLCKVGWRPWQDLEGLGGRSPQQEQLTTYPKLAKQFEKSFKNHGKSSPDFPKIEAKTILNDVKKQHHIQNRSWGATRVFLGAMFSIFELQAFGFQRSWSCSAWLFVGFTFPIWLIWRFFFGPVESDSIG